MREIRLSLRAEASDEAVRAFKCGDREIETWLRKHATKWHDRYDARLTFAVNSSDGDIAGFYALRLLREPLKEIKKAGLAKDWHNDDRGFYSVEILYFAVLSSLQRQGLGRDLIAHAVRTTVAVAGMVGVSGVSVAYTPESKEFYQKMGFGAYGHNRMMLPIDTAFELAEPRRGG